METEGNMYRLLHEELVREIREKTRERQGGTRENEVQMSQRTNSNITKTWTEEM